MKKENAELFKQFKKELKEIDGQIDSLKKKRGKLTNEYNKKFGKAGVQIMRNSKANSNKRTPILVRD